MVLIFAMINQDKVDAIFGS
uniref:Uncharacterized protein n=1 Tax=Rhizophora mucronata TaxID=61149 RepID=A0A2P2PB59_RHIMU